MILSFLLSVLLSTPQAQPNVIIISIDTLRADHLGMYGHPHDTSPHLDTWAEGALVFDNMLAEIPLTSPSFCSMMASLNPRITGSTRNGLRLPDEVQTVAQQFQGAGYETVCVTSNWTLKAPLSGLDRGFDIYDDDFHKKRWGFLKSERDADEVTRLSLEILAKRDTQKPLFAWFHYSDPHAPYKKHRQHIVSKRSDYPNDKGAKIKVRYDSEIHYTDSEIQKVMEQLPKENTFIFFVVDHGESIHEHDYLGHGRRIYQTGLRVPLAISGPGIDSGRSEAPVRGIDVGPTLLGLAGIPVPEAMRGLDVLNDEVPSNRVRVMETYGGAVPDLGITKSLMAGAKAQHQTVIHEGWKLIIGGSEKGLYHIAEDPLETNNIYQSNPEKVAALTLLWEEWDTNTARNLENDATLTDEDIQALDDLGYVGE
jgi:arylsulfatase A-like enzyme